MIALQSVIYVTPKGSFQGNCIKMLKYVAFIIHGKEYKEMYGFFKVLYVCSLLLFNEIQAEFVTPTPPSFA